MPLPHGARGAAGQWAMGGEREGLQRAGLHTAPSSAGDGAQAPGDAPARGRRRGRLLARPAPVRRPAPLLAPRRRLHAHVAGRPRGCHRRGAGQGLHRRLGGGCRGRGACGGHSCRCERRRQRWGAPQAARPARSHGAGADGGAAGPRAGQPRAARGRRPGTGEQWRGGR